MSPNEAKKEIFWIAFKSLSKKERQSIVERLLKSNLSAPRNESAPVSSDIHLKFWTFLMLSPSLK